MCQMKSLIAAAVVVLLLGSTACGAWYVGPTVGYAYYPAVPAYAYPAPVPVPAPYAPYVTYAPIMPEPMLVPGPVCVGRPVVVGPAGRVYIVGRPVWNAVRAVWP